MRDRLYLVADFNADTFARYLANTAMPDADVKVAPFGQVYQALAGPGPGTDWPALVWTQPETVSDTFRRAAAFEVVDPAQALDEVEAFAGTVKRFARHARYVFVPTWTQPCWERGYGMLDWRPHVGVTHLLARMNLALADALAAEPTIFVLDAARWLAAAGPRAVSRKPWYATKTPFGPAVFETAAADLAAALDGLDGRARRLIILDLDGILWGGIVGEVGWEGITLGGHDHAGEAFVDFQRALKALTRRGIQLAIASKNDEAVALDVIDRHPEMQLRREDFVAWRINWADKGHNVAALLRDVNLGPESAVFIDDNPVERARIVTRRTRCAHARLAGRSGSLSRDIGRPALFRRSAPDDRRSRTRRHVRRRTRPQGDARHGRGSRDVAAIAQHDGQRRVADSRPIWSAPLSC